jgi:hypothetical protein
MPKTGGVDVMAVKFKTTKTIVPDMIKQAELLNGRRVQVGVLEGEHQWLAAIHEYGCNIVAKNAKYLTVPIHPDAKGKRAGDFPELFFVQAKSGEKFLARDKGKDDMELLYWLTKSVKIPERSFLRAGYDTYINDVMKHSDELLKLVTSGKMTEDRFLDVIGQQLATKIKKYARDLSDPPNSNATTEAKGSSNPLVDTGGMINGITWRTK